MTATELRELTAASRKQRAELPSSMVADMKAAAREGSTFIHWYGGLSLDLCESLVEKGFRVVEGEGGWNDTFHKISWE